MARPRQDKERKRSRKVSLMYTESEYDEIEANAQETETTVSAFIRARSLRGPVHVPKYAMVDSRAIGELSRLGGLLKAYFNVTGGEHAGQTAAILRDMAAVVLTVKRRLDDRETHTGPET